MIRWFRWPVRVRYWKRRALQAEQRLLDTESRYETHFAEVQHQAEQERWRNIEREDYFVSAAVMGQRGMVGIPPRTGRAMKQVNAPVVQTDDPLQGLSGLQRTEWYGAWWPDAQAAGISMSEALRDFKTELSHRQPLNDEPYS